MISWQYLAGMIDADGSIGTTRTGMNRNIVGRVIIANTNHDFLQSIKEEFGGSLSLRKQGSKPNWKPFGSISWTNRRAEIVLENILPFLIIKQEQAKLVLELIKMKNMPKSERCIYTSENGIRSSSLRPEIKQKELEISFALNSLNKKGV